MPARAPEDFPPVRACLFDMDGLLLNTEDLYTTAINTVLHRYGKPSLPWSIKARLQGRPGPQATAIFAEWAQLPIPPEQYNAENAAAQAELFPTAGPLPGVPELLQTLDRTRNWAAGADGQRVHIALATSSNTTNFRIKTDHLGPLFDVFPENRRIKGDDPRIPVGRGKPHPDIFLLALRAVNESLPEGEKPITPEECLVFEDSVPGVEAGRRAGMRVVWVPHKMLKAHYAGREPDVLAGRTFEAGEVDVHLVGEVGDGWAHELETLENFPYNLFGIKPFP
ncbi:haloacid dehalogenase-like hydrolase [Plectosphaerella cucumerina]|uniref:Haloacid dehalogenase-like hydrolase n=1 Tax=Plectosphaerella cucumerina TaxID=40658 RepID=A0A8K0TW42_9PEZI|nr:haloacid dehalogenase-like hydrolase [Plectosphaerella cucumerina]